MKQFHNLCNNLTRAIAALPVQCAAIAVNFSKERFRAQNWLHKSPTPWPARRPPRRAKKSDRRAILTKSGRLRRSIRTTHTDTRSFTLGTDVPYAGIHNNGGRIRATQRVRSHTRAAHTVRAHTRAGKHIKTFSTPAHTIRAHTRQVNHQIPQRQFIGPSQALHIRLTRFIRRQITAAIHQARP